MKKTLAAAITSALVIGAASTTFAAANPFSDVPADHWSYDAVAELAQEGIVDGYGDGTFRGDRAITRYEMAQIVAKALAKDVNGDAKATLDKLAAEYADELNNLGVRVDALEKKVDNTKFSGELRLRYRDTDYSAYNKGHDREYTGMFQLKTDSQVNDKWSVKSKSEAEYNLDDGDNAGFTVKEAYAQGPLFGATAKLGKASYVAANGLIWDDPIAGASFDWQVGNVDVNLAAGSLTNNGQIGDTDLGDPDGEIASLQVGYDFTDKFGMNAGYYEVRSNILFKGSNGTGEKNKIWSIGAAYAFNDNLALSTTYAKSNLDDYVYVSNGSQVDDDAYKVNLQYKGADAADKGSFGINLGYYDLGQMVALDPAGDIDYATKGWRLATDYTVAENIVWSSFYYDAEWKADKEDYKRFQTQVEFFF